MLALGALKLEACPRCTGDVLFEKDCWGWYEQCIQCGYLHDLHEVEVKQRQAQEEKSRVGLKMTLH